MSTHSLIGIKAGNIVKMVYCHYDGYPSLNGNMLDYHYKDKEKINELLNNGGLLSLESSIEESKFYKDMGETLEENKPFIFEYSGQIDEKLANKINNEFYYGQEYVYLFDSYCNEWYVHIFGRNEWKKLKDILSKKYV